MRRIYALPRGISITLALFVNILFVTLVIIENSSLRILLSDITQEYTLQTIESSLLIPVSDLKDVTLFASRLPQRPTRPEKRFLASLPDTGTLFSPGRSAPISRLQDLFRLDDECDMFQRNDDFATETTNFSLTKYAHVAPFIIDETDPISETICHDLFPTSNPFILTPIINAETSSLSPCEDDPEWAGFYCGTDNGLIVRECILKSNLPDKESCNNPLQRHSDPCHLIFEQHIFFSIVYIHNARKHYMEIDSNGATWNETDGYNPNRIFRLFGEGKKMLQMLDSAVYFYKSQVEGNV